MRASIISQTATSTAPASAMTPIEREMNDLTNKREIGNMGHWSVSTCKPGFGVEQLRDNNVDTYWQSDGALPHHINVQFGRRLRFTHVYFHTNFAQDESYTPQKVVLKAGSNFYDLHVIAEVILTEPTGWQVINLKELQEEPIFGHYIQLSVESNHQSGKDTHIRQLKIYSEPLSYLQDGHDIFPSTSHAFDLYTIIR